MRERWFAIGCALTLSVLVAGVEVSAEQALPKLILSLGNDSYLPQRAVEEATGAQVRRDLGSFDLTDFSLVILSNIPYGNLPSGVQRGLVDFVQQGGSLLVTGGSRAYGSGGYAGTDIGAILPLKPTRSDWVPHPFGPTLILQPSHPILQGVTVLTMAFFNELDLNSGAMEIAQYRKASKAAFAGGGDPGGGEIAGGGRRPMPLIAEGQSGKGTIIAIALDLTQTGSWKDQDRFVVNTVKYLMDQSTLGPPKPRK